jgi:RNA polymerase sigma factor (TIGR02999 family)
MREGNEESLDRLMPLVYEQLKRLAHARLREERRGHTLNTTGLVHEAYLKLTDINQLDWQDREHFFAMASRVMRRILINYAAKRRAYKRGGPLEKVDLEDALSISDDEAEIFLELDDFLGQLESIHPRQAKILEHRYFGGLTNEETAETLGVSLRTVERDQRFARAWLASVWDEAPDL